MQIREYENRAMAFRSPQIEAKPSDNALACIALGITGEAGEVAELVKKHLAQGHKLNPFKVGQELGDVLWYLAAMADQLGLSLEDVMRMNLAKLGDRYPGGFSVEHSISRIK